jgi:branched-chain amino acid transport system substrate-binding protein
MLPLNRPRPRSLRRGLLGAIACGVALSLPASASLAEKVVKIGSVAPLTGPQAHLGRDNDNGVRLAVEQANARGVRLDGERVRIEVVSEDDQADPKTATIVAQKLIDAGVVAVVGHLNSGTTIPASKRYHEAGIVQVSPSATAIAYTAQGYTNAFRVMANDSQQGGALGRFAVQSLRAQRIAIIDDRTAYGQGLADEFEKAARAADGNIVGREYTTDRATDFTAILTSLKGRGPDVIFFGGMDAQGAPLARQMRALGLRAVLMSGDGLQTREFLKLAGRAAEGVVASTPGLPPARMPGGEAFRRDFVARYGIIQNYAPYAYDAAGTLIEAMEAAGSSEPARIIEALRGIRRDGVTGPLAFDEKGDIRGGAVTLYRVVNGEWQVVESAPTLPSPEPAPGAGAVLAQQLVNGLTVGALYALVALGYTMVYGILGLINFAHGEVVMMGAMIAVSVVTLLGGALPGVWALAAGVGVAALVCMALAATVERIAYRPLRDAPRLAPLITAIGVSIVLQNVAMLVWGRQYRTMPETLDNTPLILLGAAVSPLQLCILGGTASVLAGLWWLVHRTRLGRSMRATAQNRDAAQLMGVDTDGVIRATFVIGAVLGALAGVMVSAYYGLAHYYMGFMLGLKAFAAAVLGGIGNLGGAVLGGLLLGIIESLGAGYIGWLTGGFLGSHYQDVFAFIVLIIVLVLRPSGLLGSRGADRA